MTGDSSPIPGNSSDEHMTIGIFKQPLANIRHRRAANKRLDKHDQMLNHLTHSFHIGSMVILSFLLLETLLKVIAMGKKMLHHKLEVFDAFIVSSSWVLDVYFWQGIWDQPREEAATLLIYILPWRVVRIVNSFVLVIQEKDHVQLKIIKQRLRLSAKRSKETTLKATSYKTEVKQLQGLCRKYGATENEINACGLTGRNGRRRSSLVPAMEKAAALTLISALGSHPSLYTMDSSSDDDRTSLDLTISNDLTLRSTYSSTTLDSADAIYIIDRKRNSEGYITSDNESTADGLDDPVFESEDMSTLRLECQRLQNKDHVVWQCETPQEVPVETDSGRETNSGLGSSLSSS
ncbi:uncharacterized protein LOC112559546 [Pomacea canaliculata]|nr:uncharacterized protein LOC112559546 [Pomacea canaliculata]